MVKSVAKFKRQELNGGGKSSRKEDLELFDNLITMDELLVALRHNFSKHTVYKWVQKGMPTRRIGGKLWFPKKDTLLWLERR